MKKRPLTHLAVSAVALAAVLATSTPAAGWIPVSGRVLTPSGHGLTGARVELLPLAGGEEAAAVATAMTDAHGTFRLLAPDAGMWVTRAGADGFVPREHLLAPLVEAVELPPVELPHDAGLNVSVVDPTGRPAGGAWVASVALEAVSWRPVPGRVRTGDDGHARLPYSGGELLALRAQRADCVESETLFPAAGSRELELKLRRGRPRAVVVTTPGGVRLAGVRVRAGEGGWPVGLTDEAGRVVVLVAKEDPLTLTFETGDGRRGRAVVSLAALPMPVELGPPAWRFGRVTSRDAGAPVAGAVVWRRGEPSHFTRSDAEGRYRLAVTAGEAPLAAAAVGYRPSQLRLEPGVAARPAFGRVLDSGEQAVSGAEVRLLLVEGQGSSSCPPGQPAVTTDDEGIFRFAAVCPGTFRLAAHAPGFAPVVIPGLTVEVDELPAELQQPWDLGTLVLARGARLAGRVMDRDGAPVADAELSVRLDEAWWDLGLAAPGLAAPLGTTSDGEGRFTFTGLPLTGRVDLTVRAPAYALAEVRGVDLADGEDVEVVLSPGARVAGRVIDADGAPVTGAVVRVQGNPANATASRVTVTDDEGTFALDGLDPGKAQIDAAAEGYVSGPRLVVELAEGDDVAAVELLLTRGSTVSGRVGSAGDTPIPGVLVAIEPWARTKSDGQGRYRLDGVEPGERLISVRHPDFLGRTERIEVGSGVNTFDVVLDTGLAVSGRVVGEDGLPQGGARIELLRQGPSGERGIGDSFEGVSGADGRFEVGGLADGTYRLSAAKEGFATVLLPGGVEVRGAPVAGLEVVLGRGASITGRLLGVKLDDLAFVEVNALSPVGIVLDGDVEPEGRYRLDGASPGEWILAAKMPVSGRRAVVRVEIEPGEDGRTVDLDLGVGRRLTGRVLVDGQPVAGARVRLDGRVPWAGGTATTSHDGSFRVESIEPGDFELELTHPASGLHYREHLTVNGDEHRTIEVTTTHLAGRVVGKTDAQPLAGVALRLEPADGPVAGLPPRTGTSDADGRFNYPGLTAGGYRLVAEKAGYAPTRTVVEVRTGRPAETEVVLEPAAGLVLRVSRPAGAMPLSLDVALVDGGGQAAVAGTYPVEAGGLVRLASAPPGSWRLVASAAGAAVAVLPVSVSGDPVDVVLEEAARLEVVVPELRDSALRTQVRLDDARGVPLVLPLAGGAFESRWSLFYGHGSIGGLPAGSWSIQIVAADGRTWEGTGVTVSGLGSQVTLD